MHGNADEAGKRREENERDEFQQTSWDGVIGSGSLDGSTVDRTSVWTSGRTGARRGEFGT